jgi:abortive infection bacteriophage resistance protein
MQSVVNVREIIKSLVKNGLNIGDKSLLNYYIKNFNYNTFILQYSAPFLIDAQHRYDPDASSDQMIDLYKFDRDMANHILRFILVVEKIINTNVVYEIINEYNIGDKCLLKLQPSFIEHRILANLKDVEPRTTYFNFVKKLIKFLPTSEITKKYMRKNMYDDVNK